jgi:hypothetical protein
LLHLAFAFSLIFVLQWLALMSDRAQVEDVAGASDHQDVVDSASLHEGSKSEYQSDRGTEDAVEACVAADKAQQTYCFGASTITICHI